MLREGQKMTILEIDVIKEAVRISLIDRNRPILFDCRGEEEEEEGYTVIYWPSTQEIGEKLISRINETKEIERRVHSQLVDLLLVLPRGKEKAKRSIQVNTSEIDALFGPNAIDRLGVFSSIRLKESSQLLAHLYHQECRIFI